MSKPTFRIAKLTDITPDEKNANRHTARGRDVVERSLRERGFFRPMAAAGKGVAQPVMLAGNLTQETAVGIGMDEAIIVETDGTRPIVHVRTDVEPGSPEAIRLGIEDNRSTELSIDWSLDMLNQHWESGLLDGLWSEEEFQAQLTQMEGVPTSESSESPPLIDPTVARQTLAERFIIPPFSVLDARQGYWQGRKRAWLALGIQSELGRGGGQGMRAPTMTETG